MTSTPTLRPSKEVIIIVATRRPRDDEATLRDDATREIDCQRDDEECE
jgi:hypothetical protein